MSCHVVRFKPVTISGSQLLLLHFYRSPNVNETLEIVPEVNTALKT
jgi:hypothetical protein